MNKQRIFLFEDQSSSKIKSKLSDQLDPTQTEVITLHGDDDLKLRFHRERVDIMILQLDYPGVDISDVLVYVTDRLDPRQYLPIFLIIPDEMPVESVQPYLDFVGIVGIIRQSQPENEIAQLVKSALRCKNSHNQIAELKLEFAKASTDLRVTLAELLPEFEITTKHRQQLAATGGIVSSIRIGGDALYFRPIADGKFGFAIVDCSVLGLEALSEVAYHHGLIEAGFQNLVSQDSDEVENICKMINKLLTEKHRGQRIMTAFLGILDIDSMKLNFVSAANPEPIFLNRNTKEIDNHELEQGIPFGVDKDFEYEKTSIELKSGTRILMMSNGLIQQRIKGSTIDLLPEIKSILTTSSDQSIDDLSGLIQTEFDRNQTDPEHADDAAYMIFDII